MQLARTLNLICLTKSVKSSLLIYRHFPSASYIYIYREIGDEESVEKYLALLVCFFASFSFNSTQANYCNIENVICMNVSHDFNYVIHLLFFCYYHSNIMHRLKCASDIYFVPFLVSCHSNV